MSTTVTRNDAESRYEISVDGEHAGSAYYADRENQRVIYHTEVAPEFGGRGLSTTLVTGALADVREAGLRVVPVCPLVASFLRKHPEWDDLADQPTPAILSWLDQNG